MKRTIRYDMQSHTLKTMINNCPVAIFFECASLETSIWNYVFMALADQEIQLEQLIDTALK